MRRSREESFDKIPSERPKSKMPSKEAELFVQLPTAWRASCWKLILIPSAVSQDGVIYILPERQL